MKEGTRGAEENLARSNIHATSGKWKLSQPRVAPQGVRECIAVVVTVMLLQDSDLVSSPISLHGR